MIAQCACSTSRHDRLDVASATSATFAANALTQHTAMQHVLQASPPAAMVPLRAVLLEVVARDVVAATPATPIAPALTQRIAMHDVLQAAALRLQAQLQLAASHPLRTSEAGGDSAVARGVDAGGARRCAATSATPAATALTQRTASTYCRRRRGRRRCS